MLVTLPFVLLLLDYWPLHRFESVRDASQMRRLFLEKVPILIFAVTISVITYVIQVTHGSLNDSLALAWRAGNAVSSYVLYLQQMIWPADLSPLYPHPENHLSLWKIAGSFFILILISALVFLRRRSNPYLLVGWFWYVGMLLPVIGLVQVGAQGWADRYTYLPGIGIYIALVWLFAEATIRLPYRRQLSAIGAACILIACAVVARKQTQIWRDSETLWNRALAVTKDNHLAHNGLGMLEEKQGRLDEALSRYRTAAEIRTRLSSRTHDFFLASYDTNIAGVLRRQGQPDEAIRYCRAALDFQPNYGPAYRIWADALVDEGQTAEAIPLFRQAAETYPADAQFQLSMAQALLREGEEEEAVTHFERALVFDHDSLPALNNLAWIYATSSKADLRHGERAVLVAERAVQLTAQKEPFYLHKLAAAYAEEGDFAKALATADFAKKLALDQSNAGLADELQRNIDIYRTNSPLRDRRRPR
jgi:tetratricopeptide (TPR) repeat protein